MSRENNSTNRRITVKDISLPDSTAEYLRNTETKLSEEELATVLLTQVRDRPEISHSPKDATVLFGDDDRIELQLPNKTLRVLLFRGNVTAVTWSVVQEQTHELPDGHEWLILTTESLLLSAKNRISRGASGREIHYIEIRYRLQWRECE